MRWLSNLRRRRDRDHDLDREVAFHIDALARNYEAAGMSPEKARRRARIDFGGREQIIQQLREVQSRLSLKLSARTPSPPSASCARLPASPPPSSSR